MKVSTVDYITMALYAYGYLAGFENEILKNVYAQRLKINSIKHTFEQFFQTPFTFK